MPRLLIDLRPVRVSADFRRLTAGSLLSGLGGQMTTFVVALQVYLLTGSSAAVGGVGLAAGAASIVGGMAGGPVIDAVDRRRLVLTTNSTLAVISGGISRSRSGSSLAPSTLDSKAFRPWWYHRARTSCGLSVRKGTWIWMSSV